MAGALELSHHQRVHRHATNLTHWVVPLAVVASLGWIYLRLFVCWSHDLSYGATAACGYSVVAPSALLALSAAILSLLAGALVDLGRSLEPRLRQSLKAQTHFAAGYQSLEPVHRGHVRLAVIFVVVAIALEGLLFSQFEVLLPR